MRWYWRAKKTVKKCRHVKIFLRVYCIQTVCSITVISLVLILAITFNCFYYKLKTFLFATAYGGHNTKQICPVNELNIPLLHAWCIYHFQTKEIKRFFWNGLTFNRSPDQTPSIYQSINQSINALLCSRSESNGVHWGNVAYTGWFKIKYPTRQYAISSQPVVSLYTVTFRKVSGLSSFKNVYK